MSGERYDVVIVGAGPAGVTAALGLTRKGYQVALIERDTFPREQVSAGWLNAQCAPLLAELDVPVKPLLDSAFSDVTFYRADFSQSAKPVFEKTPGFLIDRNQFDNALIAAVIEREVTILQGCPVVGIQLKESEVLVELEDQRRIEGRLLLLASGPTSNLLEQVGVARSSDTLRIWSAHVAAPLPRQKAAAEPRAGVILGLDEKGSFGLCCVSPKHASVKIDWYGEESETRPALIDLCRRAYEHEAVPLDLSDLVAGAELVVCPAAAALEMDSHVGKHTLVIGDAGGFVSAASNEGIYPAMWSARIALEVAEKALSSVHSQDELMTFDSVWRIRMADYLRSPHTDIQFLLPLIFTNQPMADRMGAAFFSGENI